MAGNFEMKNYIFMCFHFQDDHYLCTALNIEAYGTQYIHSFEPNSNADRAHHMLLFTCDDVPELLTKDGWWYVPMFQDDLLFTHLYAFM